GVSVTWPAVSPRFTSVNESVPPLLFATCSIPAGRLPTDTRGPDVTVIVVNAETDSASFAAVILYVVVCVGATSSAPNVPTAPMPLSIVTEVAFDTDQRNVADSPPLMLDGVTVKPLIAGE